MASAKAIVYAALKPLASGRIYPGVAPAGAARPYIVYQGVGGVDETTLAGTDSLQNRRVQVVVWSTTASEADSINQQIRAALTAAPALGVPVGAPDDVYEDDTKLYGTRQDFSIWYQE